MIPRLKPQIGTRELWAAFSFWRGNAVEKFEKAFAAKFLQREAISFPYGRSGLYCALRALGLEGAEVICPAYTCVVVSHAIVLSGNIPVFVDSQPDACMDIGSAEEAISEKTKAIVFTSIFGHPVNLDQVAAFRKKFPNILVIQDCAHSFACEWNGKSVVKFGDIAFFGLNVSKMLTSIFGGMVTTDSPEIAKKIRLFRDKEFQGAGVKKSLLRCIYLIAVTVAFSKLIYSFVNYLERKGVSAYFTKYYEEDKIDLPVDFKIKMTNVEARVGLAQLNKYASFISARRQYAAYYRKNLHDLKNICFPELSEGATYSQIVALVENKTEVLNQVLAEGVQLGEVLEYCIPNMSAYAPYHLQEKSYPVADYFAKHAINLPVTGVFCVREAQKVVLALGKVLKTNNSQSVRRQRKWNSLTVSS